RSGCSHAGWEREWQRRTATPTDGSSSRHTFRWRTAMKHLLALIGSASLLCATDPAVMGPGMGLVIDASGALRPVVGMIGSSFVGKRVDLGPELRPVAVSPDGETVLAMAGDSALARVRPANGAVDTIATIPNPVDRVIF